LITLPKIRNLKIRNKLLFFLLIIFAPFIIISQTLIFILIPTLGETGVTSNTFYVLITLDILSLFLVFVGLAWLLSKFITQPLNTFKEVLDNSKEGDATIRLNYDAEDEIGSLAQHFNAFMSRMENHDDRTNGKIQNAITAAEKEHRKLLTQLRKAQKMEAIGILAGGIAHDFNNILSSIFGYAQLAQMSGESQEKLNTHMNQILISAQRASDLVKHILTFSRQTENGKSPLKLHLVVKEALKLLRSSIPSTIEIVTRVETIDMVNADPTQMHQLIVTLCTNAYHAMITSGGTLSVSLETVDQIPIEHRRKDYSHKGPFLQLMVEDTGSEKNQRTDEKISNPNNPLPKRNHSEGFGFTLVRAIVEDHQGISYIKRIQGHGTAFFAYLPVVPQSDATQKIASPPESGTETIMVVDDEPGILSLIEELLTKYGYSVDSFNNGESALNAYQKGETTYDMIITDMTMPRMTGIALAEAILSENKKIPIILCSGYNETITQFEVNAIGVQAFFEKPLDTYHLLKTIRKLFDK
jgi:signal transduction histidine kinase/CheY-like chemotaxis protein